MKTRAVNEGRLLQGVDERIAYAITTTPWGSSPSNVVVVAKDLTNGLADVTATAFPANAPTVVGDVITLSLLTVPVAGHTYRIEVKFDSGGNTFEFYFDVMAQT